MGGRLSRLFLFTAMVVCCMLVSYGAAARESSASASPSSQVIEYRLPCLTVYGDESHGQISRLPLKFSRTGDDKPLRILIGDDTPGGSGETIRNSVWLAAITAAMLRNDTMHGVTITLEFSGNIDGPSAGGVTCLAILSALDGRTLPDDFAMTGTILPDGTIGVVGGIPEKMRAAARSGVRRIFIPAFLRIVKDPQGEDVDLSRLAEELKVELYRVTNISEAYAILHNLPYSGSEYVNVREMTKLSAATEDVLIEYYKALRDVVEKQLAENPDCADFSWAHSYRLSPAMAETYYQEGKLLPATEQMFRTWQTWIAWGKTAAYLQQFQKDNESFWGQLVSSDKARIRKWIPAFRKALPGYAQVCSEEQCHLNAESIRKQYPEEYPLIGYFPFRKGQTEIAAQLEPVGTQVRLQGCWLYLDLRRVDESVLSQADEEELSGYMNHEIDMLMFLHLSLMDTSLYDDFLGELGDTLPRLRPNRRASEVERLFYSGAHAVGAAAWGNLQALLAMLSAQGEEVSELDVLKEDPLLLPFQIQLQHSDDFHGMLSPAADEKPSFPDYHLQASLKSQVETLAMASAVLMTYGADESNDFIPHLRRNAREAAIRNINECVNAGIPCLPAICDFEIAEATDGPPTDVLIPYWRASLYSKALLMSFRKE